MQIVIPLAGFGKRLRPHTFTKPKPLINVAGKPVLGHVLDTFAALDNVDEIIFIVGHLVEQIEEYVAKEYPHLRARYFKQEELNGQSTALYLAREYLLIVSTSSSETKGPCTRVTRPPPARLRAIRHRPWK